MADSATGCNKTFVRPRTDTFLPGLDRLLCNVFLTMPGNDHRFPVRWEQLRGPKVPGPVLKTSSGTGQSPLPESVDGVRARSCSFTLIGFVARFASPFRQLAQPLTQRDEFVMSLEPLDEPFGDSSQSDLCTDQSTGKTCPSHVLAATVNRVQNSAFKIVGEPGSQIVGSR
jgi:hypothetical protein